MASMQSPILVTGAAGFIGFHTASRLVADGQPVVGIDNLNSYYDPRLKAARLEQLSGKPGFQFVWMDLADRNALIDLFSEHRFTHMRRDFTYIDDVVESIIRLIDVAPTADPSWSGDNSDPASSDVP